MFHGFDSYGERANRTVDDRIKVLFAEEVRICHRRPDGLRHSSPADYVCDIVPSGTLRGRFYRVHLSDCSHGVSGTSMVVYGCGSVRLYRSGRSLDAFHPLRIHPNAGRCTFPYRPIGYLLTSVMRLLMSRTDRPEVRT